MMMMMMNYFCHIRPDELLYVIIIYVERDTATVSNSLLLTAHCIASMKCGATSSNVCGRTDVITGHQTTNLIIANVDNGRCERAGRDVGLLLVLCNDTSEDSYTFVCLLYVPLMSERQMTATI